MGIVITGVALSEIDKLKSKKFLSLKIKTA